MGFHVCEYISRQKAHALGLKYADLAHSSGDVTLTYSNRHSWRMPDMIKLYVEMGWVPLADFINDVMHAQLARSDRAQTRSLASTSVTNIGYLKPDTDPLPRPFSISPALPAGFLDRLAEHMQGANACRPNQFPACDEG